jgi:hypothetical protein
MGEGDPSSAQEFFGGLSFAKFGERFSRGICNQVEIKSETIGRHAFSRSGEG